MTDFWIACRGCSIKFNSVGEAYCAQCSIVRSDLRQFLHWDNRHDRMAEQIVADFKLVLPRDRELVRQLAFAFVAEGKELAP